MNDIAIKGAKALIALGTDADEAIALFQSFRTPAVAYTGNGHGNGKAKTARPKAKVAKAKKSDAERSEAMKRAWETRKANKAKAAQVDAVLAADAADAAQASKQGPVPTSAQPE